MTSKEKLARMYYKAYSALCHNDLEKFTKVEEAELRIHRQQLSS